MRKIILAAVGLLFFSIGSSHAQSPTGQIEFFYQRIQGFDFNSGSPIFDVRDESFNGGGFGFVYHLKDWVGFYTQSGFFAGVEQNQLNLKLIHQTQGLRVTARGLGPLNLYGKAGVGFARYVFSVPGQEFVRSSTSFSFGGGTEIQMSGSMYLILEANKLSMGLPDLTGSPLRDTRDSTLLFTTGIALLF